MMYINQKIGRPEDTKEVRFDRMGQESHHQDMLNRSCRSKLYVEL